MCFHMYIDVCAHACVYVLFLHYPSTSIEVGIAGSPPPPNIDKLPTHMSQVAILGSPFVTLKFILLSFLKVRKDAKNSNQYTQVPHLTQDTPS